MSNYRQQKVAHELQRCIASALLYDIDEPLIQDITITYVRVTKDLQVANVNWTCSEDANRADVASVLSSQTGRLRAILAEQVNLRRVPQLRFHYDEALERGRNMDALLKRLREEGQMGADYAAPSDDVSVMMSAEADYDGSVVANEQSSSQGLSAALLEKLAEQRRRAMLRDEPNDVKRTVEDVALQAIVEPTVEPIVEPIAEQSDDS